VKLEKLALKMERLNAVRDEKFAVDGKLTVQEQQSHHCACNCSYHQ